MIHEVKIDERFLQAIWEGRKTAELRRDDRNYGVGDRVVLREWSLEKRWGPRFVVVEITHIYAAGDDAWDFLTPGVALLSFRVHEKGMGNPRSLQYPVGTSPNGT
jgi:hypothetical protein